MSTLSVDISAAIDAVEKLDPSFRRFLVELLKERGPHGCFDIVRRHDVAASVATPANTVLCATLSVEFLAAARRAFDANHSHEPLLGSLAVP